MRNQTFLFAAICLMSMPALARDVAVRSGEHEAFTRLVFYLKPADKFEISKTKEGYLLSLSPDVTGYNLSRAFDLIGRTRVRTLTPTKSGALDIQKGCDCHIKELRLSTGELVLDIVDGPDPNNIPSTTSRSFPVPRTMNVDQQRATLPLLNAAAEQSEMIDNQDKPSGASATENSGTVSETPQLDKQELLSQLSRAASQGLIDANINPPDILRNADPADTTEPTLETKLIPHSPEHQVRMQTAVEQARADHFGGGEPASTSQPCLPDQQFDIARWGVYTSEVNAPVFESSNFLGEFDRPDMDRLVSHIRQKIYMTFGLEALQLMENYGDDMGDGAVLRMMAEVVEFGEAKSHADWDSQLTCNTRGAMWAALAQPTIEDKINTKAILRSFSELPPHLRSHLAPILARKFLNSGRVGTAVEIRNIATRSALAPSGAASVMDADIDIAEGKVEKGEQRLTDMIQEDHSQTQPAILALIKSKLQNDRGISDHELTLLASVAFEHKESRAGDELRQLHIRALFHMGRFAQAFELLDNPPNGSIQAKHLDDAGSYLVSLGSDAEFLIYLLTRTDWGTTSAEVRLMMAERLRTLGFPEHARRLVLSGDDTPSRTAREFLAEVALAQDKPKVALGYLTGLTSDNASSLRKIALDKSINPDGNSLPSSPANNPSDVWHKLNNSDHPIPAEVQKILTLETSPFMGDSQTRLQTYQGILDGSSETRTALNELLNIFPSIDGAR